MSLRLRLVLVLLALVAVGLLVSGVVTFTSLRSFLVDRVDQQLQTAMGPVSQALGERDGQAPATGRTPLPGGPPLQLPPETYGELRSSAGQVEDRVQFTYGSTAGPAPSLPAKLPGSGGEGTSTSFTAAAVGSSSVKYRVLAVERPTGGTLIVAVPLTDVAQTLRRLLLIELPLTAGVLLGLGLLAWWIVRRGLRPLEEMSVTAGAIAAGDLTRRVEPAEGRTEVGRLGLALNAMLEQIEKAFAERRASEERLRRFLADASHELRTPLTSIRGYAELFRRGAAGRPEDLATSMRRIEEEANRMGVLVDDLLLLARLDKARPLLRESVDLTGVVVDAVTDAQAADPSRTISVVAAPGVIVSGDADRLRQVVSNLLRNGLEHTPGGSPLEVTLRLEDGRAALVVADHGPGLAPGEAAKVFEPFYRADPSRSRQAGGAGLGLAIVAAIAAAHGGAVYVTSEPGEGAAFRVDLPLVGTGDGCGDEDGEDGAGT